VTPQIALAVFVGGGLGAVGRYAFGLLATASFGSGFAWGTLGVNVIGSLIIGLLAQALPLADEGGAMARLFLITGVLGGFTTFSAFSLDALQLMQRGEAGLAIAYILASVLVSIAAAALGWSAGRLI
jgi:fluoride exporter